MTVVDRVTGSAVAHGRSVDAAVAGIVLALFLMPAFDPYRHDSPWWWPMWGCAIAAPLLWRRSRPILIVALTLAGSAAALFTRAGPNWGALSQATIFIGPAVALASAAALLPRPISTRLAVTATAAIVPVTAFADSAPDAVVAQLAVVLGGWAAGEAFRARRHEIALLHQLVDSRANQAADAERARIARELHDVIAHQLAVIAIQAGAARLSADSQSQLGSALSAIEEASQVALADIRRALGVLRDPGQADRTGPQPGLQELDQLAGRLRDAGLPLDLATSGDLTGLASGLDISAYRIVQEALTNVLNHAGAVATQVTVCRSVNQLEVDVRNDPPPVAPPAPRGGHGLLGMRERVATWEGTLDAGPLPDGGFAVTARIPLA